MMVMHTYLYKSIPKVDAVSKIGAGNVTVEGCRVELSQHKYFVDATVDAVAHWDVYKPVASPNRNLKTHRTQQTHYSSQFHKHRQNSKMLGACESLTAGVAARLVRG